jgi:hypothetical protein
MHTLTVLNTMKVKAALDGRHKARELLDGRHKARELRDEGIRRARKVDKAQFLDDFRSGAMESKAFAYEQQIDGRVEQDVNARHTNLVSYIHQYITSYSL